MDFIQDLNYLRRPQNMFIDNFQTYLLDSVMGITFYMMNIFVLWLVCFSSIIRIGTVFQKGIGGTYHQSSCSTLDYTFTLVHPSEI